MNRKNNNNQLKIISLGGFGLVTQNMFVYETPDDIVIVDCGMGFPDEEMLGVDLVIPDISYLEDKKDKIRGMVLTHGHEDHIGATRFLLPRLPSVPIFGSKLTVDLLDRKLDEADVAADLRVVDRERTLKLGDFSIDFIQVTHSIPEALHLMIKTSYGNVYHGADFKIDWTPIDGCQVEVEKMVEAGQAGVDLMLSDCLRAEREGYTPSEQSLIEIFRREVSKAEGRFLVTTISSNISRLKTAIDVSLDENRKICLVGRSIRESVKTARKLGYIKLPKKAEISPREVDKYPPEQVTLLVAGSQAQTGSALDRITAGEDYHLEIEEADFVVFSSDYIPGTESSIQNLIDDLMRQGATVSYMDIKEDLHVSGHAAQGGLSLLMHLVKPEYLLPIGGDFRKMKQYALLAQRNGYREDNVLLPETGDIITVGPKRAAIDGKTKTRDVLVDGLGVGDVGNVVLRDRETLAEEGVVAVFLTLDENMQPVYPPEVTSRGFVYTKIKDGQEILKQTEKEVRKIVNQLKKGATIKQVRYRLQDHLEKFLYETTGRRPMIMTAIIKA